MSGLDSIFLIKQSGHPEPRDQVRDSYIIYCQLSYVMKTQRKVLKEPLLCVYDIRELVSATYFMNLWTSSRSWSCPVQSAVQPPGRCSTFSGRGWTAPGPPRWWWWSSAPPGPWRLFQADKMTRSDHDNSLRVWEPHNSHGCRLTTNLLYD